MGVAICYFSVKLYRLISTLRPKLKALTKKDQIRLFFFKLSKRLTVKRFNFFYYSYFCFTLFLAPSVLYLFLVRLAFLALLVEFTNKEIRVQNLLFQIFDVFPV